MSLSDTKLKSKMLDGIYGDGGGSQLYLRVQGSGRSWLFIYQDENKKRRTMGLGGYPGVSLASARKKAAAARELVGSGVDPIAAKKQAKAVVPTFAVAAEAYVKTRENGWSEAVAKMYRAYVRTHLVDLADMEVKAVNTRGIEAVLRPLWGTPTGSYVRSFVERVLDFARVKYGLEDRPNPARYRGHIEHVLPKGAWSREPHPAMDWQDVPDFMAELDEQDDIVSRALMLTILGGFRQVEVRELKWREVEVSSEFWGGSDAGCDNARELKHHKPKISSEFSLASDVRGRGGETGANVKQLFPLIRIGADRYKTRREHVVPITEPMKRILHKMRDWYDGPKSLVFPGVKHTRPLSQHRFKALLPEGVSVHGFRSSFVVWGTEAGGFTDELMQRCLGHVVGTEVTRAYQRSDFLAQRHAVHDAWARYMFNSNNDTRQEPVTLQLVTSDRVAGA